MKYNKHIKFSIIVICYNSEDTIYRCISSIISQTYRDYEIVVIDDGSTDNTFKIVKQLSSLHDNIFIYSQENKGRGEARNTGIQKSNGKFICFIDSDDTVNEEYLSDACSIIEEKKSDFIIFDINYRVSFSSHTNQNTLTTDKDYICEKVYSFYRSQSVISTIIEKSVITKNHISFPSVISFEDFFVLHKVLKYSRAPVISKAPHYNYSPTVNSVTNNICNEDLTIIFKSLDEFYNFHSSNSSIEIFFSERLSNTFKFVITKLIYNKKMDINISAYLIKELFKFIRKYHLHESTTYFVIYLLFNHDPKIQKNLSILGVRSGIISYFHNLVSSNSELTYSIVNNLISMKLLKVSILGIGNILKKVINIFEANNIIVESIYTDTFVDGAFKTIPTYDLDCLSNFKGDVLVIASYNSSKKYSDFARSKIAVDSKILTFYDNLSD